MQGKSSKMKRCAIRALQDAQGRQARGSSQLHPMSTVLREPHRGGWAGRGRGRGRHGVIGRRCERRDGEKGDRKLGKVF